MRATAFACLALVTFTTIQAAGQPAKLDAFGDPLPPGCVARLGTDRMHTTSHPSSGVVLWSPDGKRVVCTQPLSAVRVWDADTGKLAVHFDGPFDYCSVAFAPDARSLILAEKRGVVWRLALATGEAKVLLAARHGPPRTPGLHFENAPLSGVSPDGKLVYVTDKDGNWEGRDSEVPAEFVIRVGQLPGGVWIPPRADHKYWVYGDGQTVT